jgi:hypothetical protein
MVKLSLSLSCIAFSILVPAAVHASPIYKCSAPDGKSVFQQVPCNVDPLNSLADTQTSDAFKRQDAARKAAAAEADAQFAKRMAMHDENKAKQQRAQVIADEEALRNLKFCVKEEPDCSASTVAGLINGMERAAVDSVLGTPREQKIGTTFFYYYVLGFKKGAATLQVQYAIDTNQPIGKNGARRIVDNVNY